jgi:hypothetical protein
MNEIPKPEYLFEVSEMTLQDLQLSSLDRSARQLKAAKIAWGEAVREAAIATVAQYFLEERRGILEMARKTMEGQTVLVFPERKTA